MNPFEAAECKCQINARRFGLCDVPGDNNEKAYVDTENGQDWIATVINDKEEYIEFIAVDNCVSLLDNSGKTPSRCDVILRAKYYLIFVELKTGEIKWFSEGRDQILATISYYKKYHNLSELSTNINKHAYVSNKIRPRANLSRSNTTQEFFDKTGFKLFDKATIEIS